MVAHVLPSHTPAGPETVARRLVRLIADSQAAHDAGQHQQGLALAEQALAGASAVGEPLVVARIHTLIANHLWRLGQFEPSVQSARAALTLWKAAGRIDEQCDALC